jgi:ABC-type microcin C transport system duplicated ATPase subunit YejF
MKLTTVTIMSAIAIFVATMPHGVGAWLIKTTHTESLVRKISDREAVMASPVLYARTYAKEKVNKMFRNPNREWSALAKLWGKESAWNWKANNPHSSAYGIAQVLGTPQGSTIEYQVNMGIKYIVHRYDTPSKAWAFWQRNGWY